MAKKFTTTADDFFTSAPNEEPQLDDYQVPKGYRLKPLPRSERLQILVTKALKDDLKAIATREGVSVNELINTALTEYTKNNI